MRVLAPLSQEQLAAVRRLLSLHPRWVRLPLAADPSSSVGGLLQPRVQWQSVRWPDSSSYEGLVKDDKCHVRGVFRYGNGDRLAVPACLSAARRLVGAPFLKKVATRT